MVLARDYSEVEAPIITTILDEDFARSSIHDTLCRGTRVLANVADLRLETERVLALILVEAAERSRQRHTRDDAVEQE